MRPGPTYPDEEGEEGHVVAVAIVAGGHANGGDDDEDELDAVEAGPPIPVGEEAEEELADDGAEEGEEVDEQAGPAEEREVNERDGGEDDVAGEEVVPRRAVSGSTKMHIQVHSRYAMSVGEPGTEGAAGGGGPERGKEGAEGAGVRIGQKAGCGDSPNAQVPRIQIQLVAQLAAILRTAGKHIIRQVGGNREPWVKRGRPAWRSCGDRAELSQPRKPRLRRRSGSGYMSAAILESAGV